MNSKWLAIVNGYAAGSDDKEASQARDRFARKKRGRVARLAQIPRSAKNASLGMTVRKLGR